MTYQSPATIENLLGGYEPEAIALFDRITVRPNADRRAAINTLIKSLKRDGIWLKLDSLYLFAAHTSQAGLLNWCRNTANFSTINSPIFTADVGFAGDGVGASLTNTNSATVNTQPTNMMTAAWVSKVPVVGETWNIWWTGWNWALSPASSATNIGWKIARTNTSSVASSRTGLFSFARTGASAAAAYRDGALLQNETGAYDSGGTYTSTFPLRVFSVNGTSGFSTSTMSSIAYGAALNATEMAQFYNSLNDYMTAVDLAGNLGI